MSDGKPPPDEYEEGFEIVDDDDVSKEARQEPPRKKRRRKKRPSRHSVESSDRRAESDSESWALPLLLLGAGVVMCLIASVGIMGKAHAFRAIGFMLLYLIVMIPLAIGVLMIVGTYVGIDYGEFKRALLSLSAIAFFNNGIIWVLELGRVPVYGSLFICGLVCLGLFMTLFRLDMWEANISIVAINILEFSARFVFIMALISTDRTLDKKRDREAPVHLAPADTEEIDPPKE